MESLAGDELSVIKDCISTCVRGDSHMNCRVCDVLVLQLKHCAVARCDTNSCSLCGRVVTLVSLHHAECHHSRQRCSCGRYLAVSSNQTSASLECFKMMSVERVRSFLSSIFPALSDCVYVGDERDEDDGKDDDDDDDDDVDDDDDDDGNEDTDSDSSEDSIMMPSFSDIPPVHLPADKAPGSTGIAPDSPALFGRGISSPVALAAPGFAKDLQRSKSVLEAAGVAAPDPRLCVSVAAPTSTAGQCCSSYFCASCIHHHHCHNENL